MRRLRCAIYTRKSTEEGLDQEFNSLDAQREACEAFISSQKHQGWELVARDYDDGGISGGHLDRPALRRLLEDVDAKHVDQIVVYKIDRLTRSLSDFAKLVDRLDASEASFVSVTQSFNTATSMGRLTLNVLLSFAQFEREVTAERIRDKIAASKRKGLWMGGAVPLGYDADGRSLKINTKEAEIVQALYQLYETHQALNAVAEKAKGLGLRSRKRQSKSGQIRGGKTMSRGHIYHVLTNPIYAGRIAHKGRVYNGQHEAIIEPSRWDEIQKQLQSRAANSRGVLPRKTNPSPLLGKLVDAQGQRLVPSHTTKGTKRYRYYISRGYVTGRRANLGGRGWRLPADRLEMFVAQAIRKHLAGLGRANQQSNWTVEDLQALQNLATSHQDKLIAVLAKAQIKDGMLSLMLDAGALNSDLGGQVARHNITPLAFDVPFVQKRCGVETRFIMSDGTPNIDRSLISNVARAQAWLKRIQAGEPLGSIAQSEGLTVKRVQQIMTFAFLAPDIVRDIISGTQPMGLTSTWCMTHNIPASWDEQRALISTL